MRRRRARELERSLPWPSHPIGARPGHGMVAAGSGRIVIVATFTTTKGCHSDSSGWQILEQRRNSLETTGAAAMGQKTSEKGLNGAAAPVVTEPGRVRNVLLVGHSGAGKTTLVEALLAATGTISRAGTVTDGTTVSDHDPAAHRQQRSVSLACAPVMHQDVKINLLDTPGYADFVGE